MIKIEIINDEGVQWKADTDLTFNLKSLIESLEDDSIIRISKITN